MSTAKRVRVSRKILPVEFSPEQHAAIRRAAAITGTPISTWVRAAALERAYKDGTWTPADDSEEDSENTS
jgi:uncharacterized protein (DUF1778 family)